MFQALVGPPSLAEAPCQGRPPRGLLPYVTFGALIPPQERRGYKMAHPEARPRRRAEGSAAGKSGTARTCGASGSGPDASPRGRRGLLYGAEGAAGGGSSGVALRSASCGCTCSLSAASEAPARPALAAVDAGRCLCPESGFCQRCPAW